MSGAGPDRARPPGSGASSVKILAELAAWAAGQARNPQLHRYGTHPDQHAELLIPDDGGPHPVAVLLHGGFWRAEFSLRLMDALAIGLAQRGWATWNIEYRRGAGAGATGETLSDVRAAIRALGSVRAPLDLRRLVVIGHSAGGHLALSSAAFARATLTVSLAGVCDLVAAGEEQLGDGAVLAFMGAVPADAAALYASADPMAGLGTGARVLLVHGDADDRVPISQSRRYHAAALGAGDDCELLELAGVDHFAVIDPRTPAFAAYADRLPSARARD